jgi:alpha-beta hydrolase superfamily lysophospholipase
MNKAETKFLGTSEGPIYTWFLESRSPNKTNKPTLVLLHGAGQSNSERYTELAKVFSDNGISVVSLDFIGHGKTGGRVEDNSLALRTKHALVAIDYWIEKTTPLILCGSSMSGHTALRV